MADDQIQALYDRAFKCWQEKANEEAVKLIDQALALSPDDVALHALAVHIKRGPPLFFDFINHAERILDLDVHYRDVIDDSDGGRDFANSLMLFYPLVKHNAESDTPLGPRLTGTAPGDTARRICTYGTKLLAAGYGVPNLDTYMEALSERKQYDTLIDIGYCNLKLKSAAAVGLPGLDHCDDSDFISDPLESWVSDAFLHTRRDQEALEWCRALIAQYPDEWYNYAILGEIYCRFNQPAEAARQWIVAHQRGAHAEAFEMDLKTLCRQVSDPEAVAKCVLHDRMREIAKQIPAESAAVAKKISLDVFQSIGNPQQKIIQESYVERKLNAKLPEAAPRHYESYLRLWLDNQGPYPFLDDEVSPTPSPGDESPGEAAPVDQPAVVPRAAPTEPTNIEHFGVDLTARARAGQLPPIVGRDAEIDSLVRILLRMEKNNPVLLGVAGVGKTAVVQGLAERIVADDVPTYLRGRRVIEISMSALVGGTMWRGDFEQRITGLLREARDHKEIILFVDELHTMMGAGAANRGDLDAANIVKPALAKGELRLVGATTNNEYARYIEKDQAMARRFTPVRVPELDREATLAVLRGRRAHWRDYHHVEIPDEVLSVAVELTGLHVGHRRFPDKAIDLVDESCAFARTRRASSPEAPAQLTADDVRHVLREWTGAAGDGPTEPTDAATGKVALPSREAIAASLTAHLVAQDAVLSPLVDLVVQLRLSLKDPSMPMALLFHGPAKTGKSTAAHALADALWPGETDRVLTLNLSEHAGSSGLARLVGAPPGYAGHEDQGILSARLKRQPYAIVLLKNLNAAHAQVLDFLADALRHGAYADNRTGVRVSVADALFIAHVDTESSSRQVGFFPPDTPAATGDEDQVRQWLERRGVPRRLLSAFTHLFGFSALSADAASRVVRLHLGALQRAYAEKGIRVSFAEGLVERLAPELSALPPERRDVDALIDQLVRPLIRSALLARRADDPIEAIDIK